MKLVDSATSKTGVTINTSAERAGDIDLGSFEFDEPTEAEIESAQAPSRRAVAVLAEG